MKRIVVAQADSRQLTAGLRAPLAVAVVRRSARQDDLAIALKLTLGIDFNEPNTSARVLAPQAPAPELTSELDEDKLAYCGDFIAPRDACDVLLHGHIHATTPTRFPAARLQLAELDLVLAGECQVPVAAMPISAAQRATSNRGAVSPPWLRRARPPADDAEALEALAADQPPLQCAPPELRLPRLPADAQLRLEGLSPRFGKRQVTLPGLAPVAFYETLQQQIEPIALYCDTFWLDTDYERICLLWRGRFPTDLRDSEIDKLLVGLQVGDGIPSLDDLLPKLARGSCSFAYEEPGLLPQQGPDDETDLEIARYELLEYVSEPELTLAEYARVSAALVEQDAPRAEVLEAHSYDEHGWTVEERAWLERQRDAAANGDATLMADYAELFMQAQEQLRKPHEPRPLEAYAHALVALELSDEPLASLAQLGICNGEWLRLDRTWQARTAADEQLAAQLAALLQQEHTRAAITRSTSATESSS